MRKDGKKVFKYGRTGKVKERFYKHSSALGDGIILDTVIFVPSDYLSEAETQFKAALRESDHFALNKEQELIILDTDNYKSIRSIMQTIADKYNGSMAIQSEVHAREINEQDHGFKLRIKDLERMIEVLKECIHSAVVSGQAKAAVLLVQLTEEKQGQHALTTVDKQLGEHGAKPEDRSIEHAAEINNREIQVKDRDRLIGEICIQTNELEESNIPEGA